MKRMFAILLCAVLLLYAAACAKKQTETETPAAPTTASTDVPAADTSAPASDQPKARIDFVSQATADLDGDGAYEMIYVTADEGTGSVSIRVETDDTAVTDTVSWMTDLSKFIGIVDQAAGTRQIFLVGDVASGDYMTLVYRYENGALLRTDIIGSAIELYGDGRIRMEVPVNMMGTYGALCDYMVNDDYSFGPVSEYVIQTHEGFDEERMLTVLADGITARNAAGETVELPAGTKLVLRATNLIDTARCCLSTGEEVILSIERYEDETVTEWRIDGRPEDECFDNLKYAG